VVLAASSFFTDQVEIKFDSRLEDVEKKNLSAVDDARVENESDIGNDSGYGTVDVKADLHGKSNALDDSNKSASTNFAEHSVSINDVEDFYASIEPGLKPRFNVLSPSYIPRGQPLAQEKRNEIKTKWGSWTLVDEVSRPEEDFFARYPYRDVPRNDFPSNAWQVDVAYLSRFLPEAEALVTRSMEAILAELAHSPIEEPGMTIEERSKLFELEQTDHDIKLKNVMFDGCGYTSPDSEGLLARRILHAVMTEDNFNFVMGGHSAAAGHGNNFQQSYTLQFQRILEPILARLGVRLQAHNFGMGGLGTSQNAMAARDLYGNEIDILMWDSGMTEKSNWHQNLFVQQSLLGAEGRVPMLWNTANLFTYHDELGVDIMQVGGFWKVGDKYLPLSDDPVQVKGLPYAVQYLKPSSGMQGETRANRYNGTCWIDRPDIDPPTKQADFPGGRASWHPGNREHQYASRLMLFQVLKALQKAIHIWRDADDFALPDKAWHMGEHYDSIKSKLQSWNNTACKANAVLPPRWCEVAFQGRSEYLPRANPSETSIRSLVKESMTIPEVKRNLYDPPDVWMPVLDPPDGDIDVLSIVENGVEFAANRQRIKHALDYIQKSKHRVALLNNNSEIVPGKGWYSHTKSAPDNCDGTYDSFCGHSADERCLLIGHNDDRGGLTYNSLSGWLILNIENVREGIIAIKVFANADNPLTKGWCSVNNEEPCTGTEVNSGVEDNPSDRRLVDAPLCEDFRFEFAIDGEITSWTRVEWEEKKMNVDRVVAVWTLLDDPGFSNGSSVDVELAIRMMGCDQKTTHDLTHVYWA
jgi:hypothetical protein